MPATHPHPIMLYQLSGMLGFTRKNVLVFLASSKTGPNPYPPHSHHITTLSFPNLVSILKKAAFNGKLSLHQVCFSVCGTFNDIFNSPSFSPYLCHIALPNFYCEMHNYEMTVSIKTCKQFNAFVTQSRMRGVI